MKHLYQWAAFPNAQATMEAYKNGLMTQEQMLTANAKHAMLSPVLGRSYADPVSHLQQWFKARSMPSLLNEVVVALARCRSDPAGGNAGGASTRWRMKTEKPLRYRHSLSTSF